MLGKAHDGPHRKAHEEEKFEESSARHGKKIVGRIKFRVHSLLAICMGGSNVFCSL